MQEKGQKFIEYGRVHAPASAKCWFGGYEVKRLTLIIFLLISAIFAFGQDNAIVTIDEAIKNSITYLGGRLETGTKVAILNFTASTAVSNYIIEELTASLVNSGNLTVVDRSNLELLQQELDFQLSGEVSDESAQSIGKKLGAQTIISGSLSPLGNMWRMRVKALEVETAKVQGVITYTIRKDSILSNLLPKIPKTIGEKVGTGALNIFFGLGSYLESDLSGGLTLTAGYVVAAGFFVIEAAALDWDSPAVGLPATVGVTVAGLTFAYGFVRPFIYNRSTKLVTVLDNFQLDIVPTANNRNSEHTNFNVRLVYTVQF
jgi:TolB-like protein